MAYVAVVFGEGMCKEHVVTTTETHGALLMRAARSSLKASRAVWRFGGQRMADRF